MKNIKALAVALILGITGMVYAAGNLQTTETPDKGQAAASCCADCACCMKAHKAGDTKAAKESCQMGKDGCCCTSGMHHSKSAQSCGTQGCCKSEGGCCKAQDKSDGAQAKAHSCEMSKDGKSCCADCKDCQSGSCCKVQGTKQQ